MRKLVPIALLVALSACASPSDGPSATNIRNASLPHSNEKIPVLELADAPLGMAGTTMTSYAAGDA
ncbi:MAG: polysaccharide biosynthesis/export family protein, partial [Phyllobacterium sp.]